ncbi:MAG: precorrin-3B C(17)-methyltransferase [Gammaproteobacteria bacterium]|jgi:precorrin-3B C17-methyltransferase|nr:precorrin-3B C(17)-methyltransferase [Gammaproteobacteria bacterium]
MSETRRRSLSASGDADVIAAADAQARGANGGTAPAEGRGRLAVVGLGPCGREYLLPLVREELERATDIIGYQTYLALVGPFRPEQRVHGSDNREEMARARHAMQLAADGRRVVVVSSGDPGIFAMAAAVVEAVHRQVHPPTADRNVEACFAAGGPAIDLVILPGISAAQAAAAKVGAPLGHDFCTLSLSDNLKPWPQIERRLALAAEADLVLALYNPRSRARPHQFLDALAILRRYRAPETPVVLGRDVGRADEAIRVQNLADIDPEQVDMRTVVIVGSSQTRAFPRRDGDGGCWVYTPRWYPGEGEV